MNAVALPAGSVHLHDIRLTTRTQGTQHPGLSGRL
jgi:hypothetical protein